MGQERKKKRIMTNKQKSKRKSRKCQKKNIIKQDENNKNIFYERKV